MTARKVELRRCWWCKHFSIDLGDSGYSEETPGYPGRAECLKGKRVDQDQLFESAKQAEECKYYERDVER